MQSRNSKAHALLVVVLTLLVTAGAADDLFAVERTLPNRSTLRPRTPVSPLPEGYRAVFAPAMSTDPIGDAAPGAPADITALTAQFSGGTLTLEMAFNGPVAPPGSDAPNAIDAFLDIDADRNGSTGMPSWTDALRGVEPSEGTGLGIEYYVDFLKFDPDDSTVELFDDLTGMVVARIPVTFSGSSFTVQIPLSLIGGLGNVHVAGVIYDVPSGEALDAVPNRGFVEATEGGGDGSPGTLIDTGDTSPCDDSGSDALCLEEDRFEVTVDWATDQGTSGMGVASGLTDDTGYFWFFDPDNVEMVLKVLNACSLPPEVGGGRFWVFAGGLTDVQVDIRVRDTETGLARLYRNPQRAPFQPIQDTSAFETCP